ncbi:MAG: hypothetical protein ACR2H9_07105 [Longimicrobiaceae bacterium]
MAAIYLGPGGSPAYGELRQEILKSTANAVLQLTVLGVIGVAVKAAFDRHQEQRKEARERAERDRKEALEEAEKRRIVRNAEMEQRRALLRRVVAANRSVRRARILIPAHASAKTYGEQMRILIDADFELSDVRHELGTLPGLFKKRAEIEDQLVQMERYLQQLTEEYRHRYQDIVAIEKTQSCEAVRAALDHLPACGEFVEAPAAGPLRAAYLPAYWQVRDLMRQEMWEELTA